MSLILIVLVLYLTYFFTKTLSKKITNYSSSKYIKIIDRIAISQNKFLLIAEVGKKFFLLSVTDNNISVLKELDDIILETDIVENQTSFDMHASKFTDILRENLLKNKITSKFMKGNISYESDEFKDEEHKK